MLPTTFSQNQEIQMIMESWVVIHISDDLDMGEMRVYLQFITFHMESALVVSDFIFNEIGVTNHEQTLAPLGKTAMISLSNSLASCSTNMRQSVRI